MKRMNDILNELASRGKLEQAAWTATSSNSMRYQLTNKISISKGVYVVTGKAPVFTNTSQKFWVGIGGVGDDDMLAAELSSQGQFTVTVKVTGSTQIYLESRQSTSCSFNPSYLERGSITVTKVG